MVADGHLGGIDTTRRIVPRAAGDLKKPVGTPCS